LQDELDDVVDRQPSGYNEMELHQLLNKVWDNRMFLNSNDLEVLNIYLKKDYIRQDPFITFIK